MSERNVKLFYNEVCKNEKLQNEIKEILSGAKTESDKQALLNDIAKKYHFDFTSEEAKKFAENLSRNKLSLDDLSDVSGGIGKRTAILAFTALTALGSLGSAGAIVSHAAGSGDGQTPSSSTDTTKEENNQNHQGINTNENVINPVNQESGKKKENKSQRKKNNNLDKAGDKNHEDIKPTNEIKEENKSQIKKGGNDTTQTTSDNKKDNIGNTDKDKKMKLEKTEGDKRNFSSKIINEDNKNTFEGLVSETNNLQLLYRMTEDGANKEAIKRKIEGNSNVVVLVKTNENKIFGGYTSLKIEYSDKESTGLDGLKKTDDKAFLFSIDLKEKFNIKKGRCAITDYFDNKYGFCFGTNDLKLYQHNGKFYGSSYFGTKSTAENNENNIFMSRYENNNGIALTEFIGGTEKTNDIKIKYNEFTPVEIEIFEIKDIKKFEKEKEEKRLEEERLRKEREEKERKEKEREEILNKLNSEIINEDNINLFEELVCPPKNLKQLYKMTRDGAYKEAMQNKLRGHSNVVVLVKTNENKIFGGYTSQKIEYLTETQYAASLNAATVPTYNTLKEDNKSFLFSIDLNMKFNIEENKYEIDDSDSNGIKFGYKDLVLFAGKNKNNNECYSGFGDDSHYENNGITRDEFCGGTQVEYHFEIYNKFIPIEIEVFEIESTDKEYSSKIITNYKDKETFENILTDTNKIKLAYRMSKDDEINSNLIKNINKNIYNYLNNIILIKTKYGNIFGCYITKEGKDKGSFIFSIDKPDYFNYNKDSKDEIILNTNEIKLGKDLNINLNGKSYLSIGNSYNSSGKTTKDIISGKEENNKIFFEIEEIEIFNTNEWKMNQLLQYSSEIINENNINTFEELICKTNNLQLLYRMTKDGAYKEAMQNKLKGHSNVVVLVKTDENKIFGGYTGLKIEYIDGIFTNREKKDNKAFLFSIDLNKKFNIKEDGYAENLNEYSAGITFGTGYIGADLKLFDIDDNKCSSYFGKNSSSYENNGITRDEFCGGTQVEDYFGLGEYNEFTPIEIEIFEIMPSGKEYSSNIITNDKDKEIFENILTDTSKMKLAYRMSKDNEINSTTIKNIKNLYNSIILIKTKKGNTFGCYITKEGKDKKSFIFSIDKPDYFNYNKDSNDEIKLNTNEIKLGKDLNINLKEESQSYLSIGNSYNSSGKPTKDIILGKEEENNKIFFEIEEIEIFNTNEWKMNQLLPYSSEIINEDNKNIFENIVSKTNKLQLLYRMTKDGANREAMQNKLRGHSNVVVLVKTNENKIFGGYTNCKIEYNYEKKKDNKSFLFSIDLNMKFNIKENKDAINIFSCSGICFGDYDLELLNNEWNELAVSFSAFGDDSNYENNGITRDEFCGGIKIIENHFKVVEYNEFEPIEIEIFEIKDEAK